MRGQGEESEREKQIGEKVEREGGSEKRLFRLLSTLRGRRSMKKKEKVLKEEKESMQVRVATGGKTKIRDSDREGKRENEFV